MIPGTYFFATAGAHVLFCKALRRVSDGTLSRCLNLECDLLVPDDGRFRMPHTQEKCEVQLITGKLPCSERDYSAAIAYFKKRLLVKSQGIAK